MKNRIENLWIAQYSIYSICEKYHRKGCLPDSSSLTSSQHGFLHEVIVKSRLDGEFLASKKRFLKGNNNFNRFRPRMIIASSFSLFLSSSREYD